MTDTSTPILNDDVALGGSESLDTEQVTVRKAHIFIDPVVLILISIFASLGIPTIVYYGTTRTQPFLTLALVIFLPTMWYSVKTLLGIKLKIRFDDGVLTEERKGVERKIPISDITAFSVYDSAFSGFWMRLRIKGASGSFRYTPTAAFSKSKELFMNIVQEISFAVGEKNISAKIDAASSIENPALVEPALKSVEQISIGPSLTMRIRNVFLWIFAVAVWLAWLLIAISQIEKKETLGYVWVVFLMCIPFYAFWPRKKKSK